MEHRDMEDSFLTVAEVADVLKLNQQTVRNWIDQGSLPAVKVGRRVRIKRKDLDHLVEQGYRTTGAHAQPSGPSAQDFWSGEPVGVAEIDPAALGESTPAILGEDHGDVDDAPEAEVATVAERQ